jgi:SAM-dependent methyltransferase/NAD(P)-dependent dehydrogenase (short-subunit alcohol dehydrogenase family)/aryl carrier-like protein
MVNIEDVPWLADHKVGGNIVFPLAAYVCMAGEAYRQLNGDGEPGYSIRGVKIATALVLSETTPVEVVTSLHARTGRERGIDGANTIYEFSIASYMGSTWIQHCKGIVEAAHVQAAHKTTIESLPRKVAVKVWYGELARLGLRYGPCFQRIQSLTTSTKEMVAVATLSSFSAAPKIDVENTLHATSIDAALQVGIAALSKGLSRNLKTPLVPVAVEELEILAGTPITECKASYSKIDDSISIDGIRYDRNVSFYLRGLKLKEMDVRTDFVDGDSYGAAHLEWVADYDFQNINSLIKVPLAQNHDKEVIEELALLCVVESAELLKDLTPSEPYLVTYRQWLKRVSNEALANQHPVLKDTRTLVSITHEERRTKIAKLCKEVSSSPLMSAFAEGIMRIKDHIQQLFTGETDALELLLQEDNLVRIYDSISFDYSDFICALAETVPNLRILEVGAGTGGTTEFILHGIQQSPGQFPRYNRYTFSDISAGFFPKARERFAGIPNMDFKALDISKDPIQQGFEPGSYDLIIAANVVHATPTLYQTLKNLHLLLMPTGKLVLTEFCTYFRAPNYIYGNFAGWWLGEDDNRKWEPYVDTDRWDRELKAAGFNGTDVVYDEEKPWQYCATIVARMPTNAVQLTNHVSILCQHPEAIVNRRLTEDLNQRGFDVEIVNLHEALNTDGDIIATLDLEASFLENVTSETFSLFQTLCSLMKNRNLLWLMSSTQVNCSNPLSSQSLGLIRSARSELNISITTLEINFSMPNSTSFILGVLSKIRAQKDHGILAPDWEFAVHGGTLKVGRYRPFNIFDNCTFKTELWNRRALPYYHPNDNVPDSNSHNGHPHNRSLKPVLNECLPRNGVSSICLNPHAAYLITGGLGGLGRAISVWFAERGAGELIFLSRSAGTNPRDQDLFTELKSMGCKPVAVRGFVQNKEDVAKAAESATFPIKGVIHLAMQLRDAAILDMSYDQLKSVTMPKVEGTWNLHGQFGTSLDFFVMASSLSTVLGQPGQGNYNAANTFMESFCQYRHSLGLPASVLNICPIEGVGFVAENSDARRKLKSQGHWFLHERALLEFLQLAIVESNIGVTTDAAQESWVNHSHIVMGLRSEVSLRDPSNRTIWRRDRRMGAYHNMNNNSSSNFLNEPDRSEFQRFMGRAVNDPNFLGEQDSVEYLAQEIGKKILSFTTRPDDDIDTTLSLVQVGLDSLVAIELRRWWKQSFGAEVSVLEIMNCGTVLGLGEIAAEGLRRRLVELE